MELVTELIGHQGDIRCLCVLEDGRIVSGSRDRLAKIWAPTDDGKAYKEDKTLYDHEHWVGGLLTLPDGMGFVTGSQDSKIRWYSNQGDLVCTIIGHKGSVTSFAWNAKTKELISGSWDGTARTWSLDQEQKIATETSILSGHENGACVLALPTGDIVTGSSGLQAGNRIEGFQIRIWRNGAQIASKTNHSGAIRCLALANNTGDVFCSVSNDGTLRLWSSENFEQLSVMTNPPGLEGGPAFNFSVASLAMVQQLAVACDDCCARLWSIDAINEGQEVAHPCTVWCVAGLPNGDLATGGSDGYVRVFTSEESRKALLAVRQNYIDQAHQTRLAIANKASNGGKKVDPESLTNIFDAQPGNSEGDVKMFNKEGVAWVYQWSADSRSWIEIGEVMGDAGKEELDGKQYDRVIPVELEDPGTGGLRKLKLGINNDDNPFLVAQQFVAKHELSENHVEEIANFIQSVRGQNSAPTIDMSGGSSTEAKQTSMEIDPPIPAPMGPFPLPAATGMCFEAVDLDKVMQKFIELNASASPSLSEQEITAVRELVGVLKNTSRYHATVMPQAGIGALLKAMTWSIEYIFPVLDLVRISLTHPDGSKKLCKNESEVLVRALDLGASEGSKLAVALLASRVIANFFRHQDAAQAGVELALSPGATTKVVSKLNDLSGFPNKNVRLAVATALMNYVNALFHLAGQDNRAAQDVVDGLAKAAINLGNNCLEQGEFESLRRCLLALGCATLFMPNIDTNTVEEIKSFSLSCPEDNDVITQVRTALIRKTTSP